MNRWKEKVALVTGADNVIGIEIVKVLAKNGMKVIASAEIRNEVEELAANIKREYKIEIYPIACDLRKEEDILNMIKWADEKLNGIDVLINNASVSCKESIIEGKTTNFYNILHVNVIGAAICSREVVQSIKRRNAFGHIINMCSLPGHYAELFNLPMNLYPASKSALNVITVNLRTELRNINLDIKVTTLSPGPVEKDEAWIQQTKEDVPLLLAKDVADVLLSILATPQHVEITQLLIEPHKPFSNARWYAK